MPTSEIPSTPSPNAPPPWLEVAFRAHYGMVVRWARALGGGAAAEDIAQEVFLIAHRRRDQLAAPSGERAWLLAITRRACANARRGGSRHEARQLHADPPVPLPTTEYVAERKEAAALMQAFLDRLPQAQRLVFALIEIEGLDAPETAALLDTTPTLVHARLRSARARLARFVQQRHRATRGER